MILDTPASLRKKKLPLKNIQFAAPEKKAPAKLASDWCRGNFILRPEPFNTSKPEVEEKNGYEKPDIGGLDEIEEKLLSNF